MTEIDADKALAEQARTILNHHLEYQDGLSRGQVHTRTSNALAAVIEALSAQASRVAELEGALEKIGSQAICYGMTADESELRDWLKNISDIAESAIGRVGEGQ